MSLLAPPLNRLIDAAERFTRGQALADEVRSCLPAAREFCAEGRGLFRLIAPGLLRTPEVERLLEECAQDLDAQEKALTQLEEALATAFPSSVGSAAGRLREAATRLAGGYGALHEEEQKEKIYSPFPALDHFLKVGMNVLEGRVPRGELAERFPPVVSLVERLGRDVSRFRALYEAPAVAGSVSELVGTLQAGLGAVVQYFETGKLPALADGLKLLGRGSAALQGGLVEMDRIATTARKGSHPYLEELRMAVDRHAEGRLPWLLVRDAWQLVGSTAEHYHRELDAFRRFPLYPFLQGEEGRVRAALDTTVAELARLEPQFAHPGRPDLAALEASFDLLARRVAHLWDRLEEELVRYAEAPHVEELRERVGRALLGEPSEELLRERLLHFHEVQQGLAGEAAAGGLDPALAHELTMLFAGQDEGYRVMLDSLETRDLAELRRGWEALEATLPRMLELVRGLRQALQAVRDAAPAGPRCLRCGQENARGTRYCTACGAVLPEMAHAPTEYTDITGGAASSGITGTRLSLLEDLVARAEVGEAEPSEVLAEVAALEAMATQVARTLETQVAPAAQGEAADFAAFFRERVDGFLHGLEWIRACVEAGDVSGMWQGLEACRQAGHDIVDLKAQIDASMGSQA